LYRGTAALSSLALLVVSQRCRHGRISPALVRGYGERARVLDKAQSGGVALIEAWRADRWGQPDRSRVRPQFHIDHGYGRQADDRASAVRKGDPVSITIPTVLVTAYVSDGVRERSLSAGVIG
jgi:hypothetical protein